jgi:hypothetical protein
LLQIQLQRTLFLGQAKKTADHLLRWRRQRIAGLLQADTKCLGIHRPPLDARHDPTWLAIASNRNSSQRGYAMANLAATPEATQSPYPSRQRPWDAQTRLWVPSISFKKIERFARSGIFSTNSSLYH